MSLARVSVLRGDGSKEGVPFLDDHIHTSETIVDYLTEYSGIRCKYIGLQMIAKLSSFSLVGDLDPHRSPHTLTPLKVVYKKLRLLVDRGCVFIGHGLSKDFRIISRFLDIYFCVNSHNICRHIRPPGSSSRYCGLVLHEVEAASPIAPIPVMVCSS